MGVACTIPPGEYDYQYVEQSDADTYQPKISKRASKKDVVKVDFDLVEYNGVCVCHVLQPRTVHY